MINVDENLFLPYSRNIIAITSGVGSQGKTWLSITLAHALNSMQKKTLLFDADNGLSNINFQLGSTGKYYLDNVLTEEICLNQSISSLNRKGFDFIGGTIGSEILDNTSNGKLQILKEELEILSKRYDKVIIDMPVSEKVINHFLPKKINLILVCTNDPSNLVSTYQFLHRAVEFLKYNNYCNYI